MGHHCTTCTCEVTSDTVFLRYERSEDKRDPSQQGRCSQCKDILTRGLVRSVVVRYATGSRRYYDEQCASNLLGWDGEYTSTIADQLIFAQGQLEAGVIDEQEFLRRLDAVT